MASGMGLKGNTGRCFRYFEEFAVCMKTSGEPLVVCGALRDDYLECLHNQKGFARRKAIDEQKIENDKASKSSSSSSSGGMPVVVVAPGGGGGASSTH